MADACRVCNHPHRLAIDRELVQGKSKAGISRRYSVPYNSVDGHAQNHLSHQLRTAYEKKSALEGLDLLSEIEELIRRTKRILDKAESENKLNTALNAIGQARGSYELLSKIAFSLHQARVMELELEREKAGANDQAAAAEYQESLSILDDWELELFEQLIDKIHSGDERKRIRLDAPRPRFPQPRIEDEPAEDFPRRRLTENIDEKPAERPKLRRKKQPWENYQVRAIEPSPIPYTPRLRRKRKRTD
jgi:hypothetical protein